MVRNYATESGQVTERYLAHIERIARGGVGTIILEASYISPAGKGFKNQLAIHSDRAIEGLQRLTRLVSRHGVAVGIQLYHAGRQTSSKTTGYPPVAPSALADPTIGERPHALEEIEIMTIVHKFAEAARRAKRAGFDFVELHGAHGYLIQQFLSPFSNRRSDRYGGSLENRCRLLFEVYEAVREAVGINFPVTVRLSAEEMVTGGLTIKETTKIAQSLEELGVDALHISAGNYASFDKGFMIAPMGRPDGLLVKYAADIKKAVKLPIIAVGKIRFPYLAEAIITKGQADLVALGRTLLADPDWPRKVQAGKNSEINHCIACNQGCISRLFAGKDVRCTVNPICSFESKLLPLKKVAKSKKVLVAGGGPAGLTAAYFAASRGHRVTIYEKNETLGGQLWAAAAPPYRSDWEILRRHLIAIVKKAGVIIHLKKELTAKVADEEQPDAVVVATGSTARRPSWPGVDMDHVISGRDVLEKKVPTRKRIVVVGGGRQGAQVAEYLAGKRHKVTIVEMTSLIAAETPSEERSLLLDRLRKLGVKILTFTKVGKIAARIVSVEDKNGRRNIAAETVVMCLGSRPERHLKHELKTVVRKIFVAGDANDPRGIMDAVQEGMRAGLGI